MTLLSMIWLICPVGKGSSARSEARPAPMLDIEGWLGRDSPDMRTLPPLPARVGPAEFGELGKLVAVRAPREFDDIFRRAGGTWEPGSRRWLIERHRIGPVIRALRSTTDPLFRRTGVSLD
jgi:hypothetical protein